MKYNIKIPKVIHQIYIGEKEMPNQQLEWRKTWQKFNPDWELILWDDERLKTIDLQNKDSFKYCKSIASKVDLIRYEIIYNFGGLYIDTDFECLKSIDSFFHDKDFIACRQNPNGPTVANGFIAAIPKHEILSKLINDTPKRCATHKSEGCVEKFGPRFLTDVIDEIYGSEFKYSENFDPKNIYPYMWMKQHRVNDDFKNIYPDAYAVHHWAQSWCK